MSHEPLRIAVIGAGIGGLAAAVALTRVAGAEVRVFEQARALGEVGAGIGLAPNGQRGLEHLGLRDAVEHISAEFDQPSTYHRADGTIVGEQLTEDSTGEFRVRGIHRADLVGLLADALPDGIVQTRHRLTALHSTDPGVELEFDNGVRETFDAVVGADGIHSIVRDTVTQASEPVYSGSIAYRGTVDAARLPSDWPMTLQTWMGDGKHFLCYPVRQRKLFNYVGFVHSDRSLAESWSAEGDVEELVQAFAGWDPALVTFIGAIEQTFWWGVNDREPLATWSRGRVTLLGDAAHAMLPHASQGLNQAIEDSLALAGFLRGVGSDGVAEAFTQYEQLRLERTKAVQAGSRRNGQRYDSQAEYSDIDKRDTDLQQAEFRQWIFDYDALAAATAAR